MMMKINPKLLAEIISDLGLNVQFVKGENKPVRNCWHFSTDGNAINAIFYDEDDFIAGMNRIYVTLLAYRVVILAFTLMDTHVHFILYGDFDECNRFMHDYIRRTSWYISTQHGESHKLGNVPINHQEVDTDSYLKTVICYTLKNAPVGGIAFNALNYPWSSGSLYFQRSGYWSSPEWMDASKQIDNSRSMTVKENQKALRTRYPQALDAPMIGDIVFPGEYVAYEIVERLFKTCKSFNFFMCRSREADVDSRGGTISHLSIPIQEMRQHKNDLCREMFDTVSIKGLDTRQRLTLAKALRSRYNSSVKQITRLCGLVYDEVKGMI